MATQQAMRVLQRERQRVATNKIALRIVIKSSLHSTPDRLRGRIFQALM
jgi:hypothetical protein